VFCVEFFVLDGPLSMIPARDLVKKYSFLALHVVTSSSFDAFAVRSLPHLVMLVLPIDVVFRSVTGLEVDGISTDRSLFDHLLLSILLSLFPSPQNVMVLILILVTTIVWMYRIVP
jgi:hypothetical protein